MMKMKYFAPETELVEIRFEEGLLTFSNGNGTASADKMNAETWDSWE